MISLPTIKLGSRRGLRPLLALLMFILFILTLLQLNHLYSIKPLLSSEAGKAQQEQQQQTQEGQSSAAESMVVHVVKPDDSASQDAYAADKSSDSTENVHKLQDYSEDEYNNYGKYENVNAIDEELSKGAGFKSFMNELLDSIVAAKPAIDVINNVKHYNQSNSYPVSWDKKMPVLDGKLRENKKSEPIRSKEYLQSFIKLSDNEFEKLKESHKQMMENLPKKFPDEIEQNIQGKGILYAGGGQYNWLVLLSLKMLRDTGSRLPVEVFIPTNNEYSSDLCERVFPIFGAKCIVMENYIDVKRYRFKGYQLKSMALMLTSFEHVLLLDSDNIPLKNPDLLFINEPYTSNGMIVWPDFWRRSTSPLFYDIADIAVSETNQVRFSYGDERDFPSPLETADDYFNKVSYHDMQGTFPEASAETGQLLINKKTHASAIFLSLYYNFFGPGYFYGLLSQGQAGEGDKETLLAAAHKMGLPYYQVQEFIREYGEEYAKYEFHINAMGQYDPTLDYLQGLNVEMNKDTSWEYASDKNNYPMHRYKNSETMFLHCNQPKLYPWKIDGKGFRTTHAEDGSRRRIYSKRLMEELGYDVEAKIWRAMEWILCKHGDIQVNGLKDSGKLCGQVREQLEFLDKDAEGNGQSSKL